MPRVSITKYKEAILGLKDIDNAELATKCAELERTYRRDTLFRYRKISKYTFDEIKNQNVFLCEPQNFDDIFDCKYAIPERSQYVTLDAAVILNKFLAENFNDESAKKNYKKYIKILRRINKMADLKLRITAFTEKNDNIPMWYYYASKHRGICIEYDLSEFNSFLQTAQNKVLLPVIYPLDRDINKYRCVKFTKNCENAAFLRNALVKSNDWNFEKEWRLISFDAPSEIHQNIRISKIYLGMKTSKKNRDKILEIKKDNNLDFEVYKMVFNGVRLEPTLIQD